MTALGHLGAHLKGEAMEFYATLSDQVRGDCTQALESLSARFTELGSAEEAKKKLETVIHETTTRLGATGLVVGLCCVSDHAGRGL